MKKHIAILLCLMLGGGLSAQVRITGTVLDAADRSPMTGVTVAEQGTPNGTTTDRHGKFSLTVSGEQSVLTVSFLGMVSQNVLVGRRTDLTVLLEEDTKQIESITVQIGYGDARSRNVAGSLGVLGAEDLSKSQATSFMDALQGRMAGVMVSSSSGEPGSGTDITIRGGNSIYAGTQPLYIIDDVQMDVNANEVATSSYTSTNVRYNPLTSLNPADIESVTVLKDASATAIYGSRGANGVIIVTTKSGRGEKASVDFDMSFGVSSVTRTLGMLQGQDYAEYRFAKYPYSHEWGIDTDGDGFPDQVRDFSDYPSHNWQKEVMRRAWTQNYNLSVTSGGSSRTRFSSSFGYLKQEGLVRRNKFERFTGRLKADSDITDKLTVGGTINVAHMITKGAVTNAGGIANNGLIQSFVLYRPILLDEFDDDAANPENYNMTNPVAFVNDAYKNSPQTRTFLDTYVRYKLMKNLTLRLSGGGTLSDSKTHQWYPSTTSWGYSRNGLAEITESNSESWQSSNTLTYAVFFGGRHYINAVVGFELGGYTYSSLNTRAEGFENESFDAVWDIGQANVFPINVQTLKERNTRESEFARLNYILSDKYVFTGTIRRDGSSKFGKDNKYAYFPSGAFAWKVDQEKFMKKQRFLSELKLRASYGASGNDRISPYRSLSRTDKTYYAGDDNSVWLGLSPAELANPELKWETTYQANLGLDIGLLRNRLSVVADVYHKKTKDMLLQADVASQIGSYRQWQNIGQVNNKGLELTVNSVNIITRDFTWSTSLNFNMNRNKVVSLGSVSSIPVTVSGGHITEVGRITVGKPIGSGWGYVFDGIYQESDFNDDGTLKKGVPSFSGYAVKPGDIKFLDLDGDGTIDPESDKKVISRSDPLHFGGLSNTLSWKNLELSFLLQWSYGNEIINIGRYRYEGFIGYSNVTRDYWFNRWTAENGGNRYPGLDGQGKDQMSSYYVEDGSYLRLKNITLAYTLPYKFTKKINLSNVRVYVTGENLLTWTGYSGYDPEVSFWNKLISGLDYINYPRARTVTFGISMKFN